MFELLSTGITDCFQVQPRIFEDERGRFVKVFHNEAFSELGLETNFVEEYYSCSRFGVVRGLHFQSPPVDHAKIIYCVEGEVFDVVLDIRIGSPTYGENFKCTLSAHLGNYIYVPKGLAHGFCVTSEKATLVYKVSSIHFPQHDNGILWNSADINWPKNKHILSDRDLSLPRLKDFVSPFFYKPKSVSKRML